MICPHCEQNLLRKERPGMRCSKCGRPYAFDPKDNTLRLSDVRIRRLVKKISDEGRVSVSVSQLWFAVTRSTRARGESLAGTLGCSALAAMAGGGLIALGLSIGEQAATATVIGGIILWAVLIVLVVAPAGRRNRRKALAFGYFTSVLMSRWQTVYGALPAGVVDDSALRGLPRPERPAAVLLCPDRSIAAFLAANGVPQRHTLALVPDVRDVQAIPGTPPVIVLHHADPIGCRLPGLVRAALPGRRVVDAGLPPRAVMNAPGALPLLGDKPEPEVLAALHEVRAAGELTDAEVAWLAKGRSGSLAGVPPVKLLAVVTKVVERVTAAADPARHEAEAVGFLTWPGEVR